MSLSSDAVTAGVLAGGESRRMGGIDKGWIEIAGQSLIERTLDRLRDQSARIVINANRNIARYNTLGYPVVIDDSDVYRGPLAGIAALLQTARTPWMLLVPVDTPMLPLDLFDRLVEHVRPGVDIVASRSPRGVHPLHALVRREQLTTVHAALQSGVRRVTDWQSAATMRIVDWPNDEWFANINTMEQADRMAEILSDETPRKARD